MFFYALLEFENVDSVYKNDRFSPKNIFKRDPHKKFSKKLVYLNVYDIYKD